MDCLICHDTKSVFNQCQQCSQELCTDCADHCVEAQLRRNRSVFRCPFCRLETPTSTPPTSTPRTSTPRTSALPFLTLQMSTPPTSASPIIPEENQLSNDTPTSPNRVRGRIAIQDWAEELRRVAERSPTFQTEMILRQISIAEMLDAIAQSSNG